MNRILVTGFSPFGGEEKNASWEAVSLLPDAINGVEIKKIQLPVEYDGVEAVLQEKIKAFLPDAVICVGQAAGRANLTPEKVAINWKSATIADNAGVLCSGESIFPGEADAYFSTLPVEEICSAIKAAGIPAAVSYTAGAYVCNCTMYHLLRILRHGWPQALGGFIHVPCTCEQALSKPNTPSLPLEIIAKGLEAAIAATAQYLILKTD